MLKPSFPTNCHKVRYIFIENVTVFVAHTKKIVSVKLYRIQKDFLEDMI